ncbi:MAG: DUF4132 domain-containing protein [Sandaracinaceae bacterium]|nr:DUF4132 domain-containing protein [Sandaracinaceae bacterium]
MSDLLRPRPLDRAGLRFPDLDVDAALAALEDEAGEVRPSREDDLRARLARGDAVSPRELFDVLDAEESERLFFELVPEPKVYPPDEVTLRYAVARFGDRLLPFVEKWASWTCPELLGSWGSVVAAATLVVRLDAPEPDVAEAARAWLDAHEEVGVLAAIQYAGGDYEVPVRAREWLAERHARCVEPLVRDALSAGHPHDRTTFPYGSPVATLAWYLRRWGREAVDAACPAGERERLDALLAAQPPVRFYDAFFSDKAKWWPKLDLAGADRAVLERCHLPDHPDLVAMRATLDPEARELAAHAVLDAFIADKAKPMFRFAMAVALGLAPDAMVPRLARQAWAWSRDKNRNHRNLVPHVARYLGGVGSPEAIARLGLMAEGIGTDTHRAAAQLALRFLASETGRSVEDLLASSSADLGLSRGATLSLDFGPRQFSVRFDSEGKAQIVDDQGKPRASLPKPGKKDDPVLAAAAQARFAETREDLKHLLKVEARRLEAALRERRRWTLAALLREAEDPARRLLLGALVFAHEGGTFRIADEGDVCDAADEPVAVTSDVWIAHPLELDAATLDAWKQALSDYELIPPWSQLEREVYEAPALPGRVDLCADWVLHPGSLVGLLSRGWRGDWRSGGLLCGLRHRIDGGFARIEHAEFVAKRAGEYPPEPIGPLYVDAPSIDRLTLSELLRDLGRERLG